MDPLAGMQSGLADSLKQLQGDYAKNPIGSQGKAASEAEGVEFGSLLGSGIQDVVELQRESKAKTQGLVTGETQSIHEVMIANEKAGVAFEMMLEIRNKLMSAWKEVTRLQV